MLPTRKPPLLGRGLCVKGVYQRRPLFNKEVKHPNDDADTCHLFSVTVDTKLSNKTLFAIRFLKATMIS
jgi:hypothetical protein